MRTACYGSWASPVSVELMTSSSVGLGTPTVDGDELYWTETRADQGGRTTLMRLPARGAAVELTPAPINVRSRVHEYGGGEYAACAGVVVFSDLRDGRLYRAPQGRGADVAQPGPTPITPAGSCRFAALRLYPERNLLLAVREDHGGPGEPVNSIVVLRLDETNEAGGVVICSGADFYADPTLGSDGRLAWTEWDHPHMPWDATRIMVGDLQLHRASGSESDGLTNVHQVAGGPSESAVHAEWLADGTLIFLSDVSGWWNLYAWRDGSVRALRPAVAEFCRPLWRLGQHPYAVLDDDHLLVTWSSGGSDSVGELTLSTGELALVAPVGTSAGSVSAGAHRSAAVLSSPDRPPRLACLDRSSRVWSEVRRASEVVLEESMVSLAQSVSWPSESGLVHGWFYPPTNSDFEGPADSLPPLITLTHGGPTANSGADFGLSTQYWTSRGVAILDVNYGGSSGYGRAYRERLKGRWGLVDVTDCATGAVAMGDRGLADPHRLAIAGGSAGGYTTLRALTSTDVFHAGISLYGVGDLESLARDTHKFESRYLDGLVGPYPAARETYLDRSPVQHVDQLSAPILLLQGDEDKVVPPNQAEAMAAAARANGLPVALIVFPGEGHGFRRAENIRTAIEAQLAFLGRVFDFSPADELPAIVIDNLPAREPAISPG